MDGRVLTEIIDPSVVSAPITHEDTPTATPGEPVAVSYSAEEEEAVRKRLALLGYP